MRTNPSCRVCALESRKMIDDMIRAGLNSSQVVMAVANYVESEIDKYDVFDIEYMKKRAMERLSDKDIVDRNRMLEDLEKKKNLADIGYEEVEEHASKHVLWDDNQRYKKPVLDNNDVLEGVDFTQILPETEVAQGVESVTFKNCIMINCLKPENGDTFDCNFSEVSFCSNVHSELKDTIGCDVICKHVVSNVAELEIDGVVVARDIISYCDTKG